MALLILALLQSIFLIFFNDTATTEIYTSFPTRRSSDLRLDAGHADHPETGRLGDQMPQQFGDRKSTRLNSSHQIISYAVFCLKKKNSNAPLDSSAQKNSPYYSYFASRRNCSH